jgi:hypothetical protein
MEVVEQIFHHYLLLYKIVKASKCWNQLILTYNATLTLEIRVLKFSTWEFQNFPLWFSVYIFHLVFLHIYTYFIRYVKIIQEWSYNPKIELDLVLSPLFLSYEDFFILL